MTLQEARDRVRKIHEIRGDDEAAHAEEDDFYLAIFTAIADGSVLLTNVRQLAEIAISSQHIDFARWTA